LTLTIVPFQPVAVLNLLTMTSIGPFEVEPSSCPSVQTVMPSPLVFRAICGDANDNGVVVSRSAGDNPVKSGNLFYPDNNSAPVCIYGNVRIIGDDGVLITPELSLRSKN